MTWTRVQKSTAYATSATGTLPSNATAGNLVVAFVHSTTNSVFTGPPGAGWYQGPGSGVVGTRTEIWYLPPQANFGGFSSVTFGTGATARCALAEYHTDVTSPMVVIDGQGSNNNAAATSLVVTEGGSNVANDLGVCAFMEHFGAGTAVTWTDPSGFTVSNSMTASNANQAYAADSLAVASGTLSVTGSTGVSGAWSGGLVLFRALTVPAIAIFVPPLRRPHPARRAIVAAVAPGAPAAPPLAAAPTNVRRRAQVQALRARQAAPGSPPKTPLPPTVVLGEQARHPWRPARRPSQPVPTGGVSQPPLPASPQPRRPVQRRPLRSRDAVRGQGQAPVPAAGSPAKHPLRKPGSSLRARVPPSPVLVPPSQRRAPWRGPQHRTAVAPPSVAGGVVPVSAGDSLGIADSISVFTGIRWEIDACRLQWAAEAVTAQWNAEACRAQWRILMADFDPIAAISQEPVPVVWTSEVGGMQFDPTDPAGDGSQPALTVRFAFPPSSGNANAPAEPVTWYLAAWVANTTSRGFFAECMVGPGTSGPSLTAGQSYDVWSEVAVGASNIVAKFAGTLPVY